MRDLKANEPIENQKPVKDGDIPLSRQTENQFKKVTDIPSFSERWRTSRFWLLRGSYIVLRSVWMVTMFIGGLIAWLISLLFI